MSFSTVSSNWRAALCLAGALTLTACAGTKYTESELETLQTMGASQYQPRTQMEREAIETQDLFAQTAFWSREYDLNPADLEAAIKLSASLRKMGNPSQALEIARTARAMFPRDTNLVAEYSAGLIAMEAGKDAIQPLSAAVRQDPRNPRLWSLLGAAHDQIGKFTKAREFYGRALNLSPQDSNILANVGLSYALEGDPRTAEIWLRRAAENPQASAHVRQNLALVLGLQGKFDEAEGLAREDLNAAGAENNLAYLKSLKGGQRTYEALANPGATPAAKPPVSAPRFRPPAGNQPAQIQPAHSQQGINRQSVAGQTARRMPARSLDGRGASQAYSAPRQQAPRQHTSRPQASRGPVMTAPKYAPNGYNQPAVALPQTAPNVSVQQGGAREAALAAARQMQARGGSTRTIPATPGAMGGPHTQEQKDVLARIASSLGGTQQAAQQASKAEYQARAQAQANAQAQYQQQMQARAQYEAQMQGQRQGQTGYQQPPRGPQSGYPQIQQAPANTAQQRGPARRRE